MTDYRKLRTVIIGSYRKHLTQLFQLRRSLEQRGILVLSPVGNISANPEDDFILLDEDPFKDPRLLQDSVFAKIRTSSFVTVGNFDNYLGTTAIFEMGYCVAFNIPLLSLCPIYDPNLAPYCRRLNEVFSNFEPHNHDQDISSKSESLTLQGK